MMADKAAETCRC